MRKVAMAVALVLASQLVSVRAAPPLPKTLRLYVFDCGVLNIAPTGVQRYHVTAEEVGEPRMSVPCFLIAHPKGTLMWDLGVVPDAAVAASASERAAINTTAAAAVVTRTLTSQLAQIGYSPKDISYVAISHAHNDHSANLNQFAASTWLARPAERDFMWAPNNARVTPALYSEVQHSKSIAIDTDEYDVFGDGRVVLKAAPGHTPGHQVLILNLKSTGRVMLSGDLYHYPAERTRHTLPPDNEADVQQSAASRMKIEDYLARTTTTLWIEHDFNANAKLRKAPGFYE